jgi:hypothetical protein
MVTSDTQFFRRKYLLDMMQMNETESGSFDSPRWFHNVTQLAMRLQKKRGKGYGMSFSIRLILGSLCLGLSPIAIAQQPTTAIGFLQTALANLGASSIQSTSLSGTSQLTPDETDATGTFTAQCGVNGYSQLQFQISSNNVTENRQNSNGSPTGTWIDDQGQTHQMAGHNVLTPAAWFCPHIALASIIQNQNLTLQLIGKESRNGASVVHVAVAFTVPDSSQSSQLIAHITQTDIYLDSVTLRPVAFVFNTHPDNNALLDMPVEIDFGNYTESSGVWIPYSIQKSVNSTPALSLQVQSATLSATAPAVQ